MQNLHTATASRNSFAPPIEKNRYASHLPGHLDWRLALDIAAAFKPDKSRAPVIVELRRKRRTISNTNAMQSEFVGTQSRGVA
jgi:hypothetical protein